MQLGPTAVGFPWAALSTQTLRVSPCCWCACGTAVEHIAGSASGAFELVGPLGHLRQLSKLGRSNQFSWLKASGAKVEPVEHI